ncbi:hypothetical protein ACLIA0_05880 [Bacillaceae bacterium W0354]
MVCGKLKSKKLVERTTESGATVDRKDATAEKKRTTAEKKRTTAEKKRTTAEKKRTTAEKKHATAEKKRTTAENKHTTAEKTTSRPTPPKNRTPSKFLEVTRFKLTYKQILMTVV